MKWKRERKVERSDKEDKERGKERGAEEKRQGGTRMRGEAEKRRKLGEARGRFKGRLLKRGVEAPPIHVSASPN